MTRARVQTLLPSLNVSQKLAAIGDVVGTMRQDRSTAIAGTLGRRSGAGPGQADAAVRSRAGPDLHLRDREGPAVHAAPDLRVDRQHAAGLRARVRRRHVPGPRHGAGARPRRRRHRRRLRRRLAGHRRRRLGLRPARRCCCATSASRSRSTASSSPSSRSRSRAPRASSASGSARREPQRRRDGAGPRRDALVSRRGAHPHDPDPDSAPDRRARSR